MTSQSNKLFLHDHPVSSYAQKIRIALREKNIPFDFATPKGLGSGQQLPGLSAANPRLEVPALEDGEFKIFDSTVILGYIEDKFPEKPLLPKGAKERAVARMIEEVCDTHYEVRSIHCSTPTDSKHGNNQLTEIGINRRSTGATAK